MRTVSFLKCGLCEQNFFDRETCLEHELTHLNITKDVYTEWKRLKESADYNSRIIMRDKNETTKKAFDSAVERLVEFEKQNNIDYNLIGQIG